MQRTALKIIVSVAFVFGLIATPASAAAAPPACGNPGPVTAHDGSSAWIWLGATCQDADLDHLTFEIVTAAGARRADRAGRVRAPSSTRPTRATRGRTRSSSGRTTATRCPPRSRSRSRSSRTVRRNATGIRRSTSSPTGPTRSGCSASIPDSCCELTYTVVDPPQHGVLGDFDEFEGFTYTPEPGYHGPDSFTITANDGLDDSDPFTVNITVLGPNNPPTCATPLTLRVPVNGSLPLHCVDRLQRPGRRIRSARYWSPARATASFTFPNDVLAYMPDRGYAGPDRIDYRVTDARGAQVERRRAQHRRRRRSGARRHDVEAARHGSHPRRRSSSKPGQRLRDVRTKGLKLLVTSSEAGQVAVRLSVSRATAKRLELGRKPQGRVVVGFADRTIRAGSTTVSVSRRTEDPEGVQASWAGSSSPSPRSWRRRGQQHGGRRGS